MFNIRKTFSHLILSSSALLAGCQSADAPLEEPIASVDAPTVPAAEPPVDAIDNRAPEQAAPEAATPPKEAVAQFSPPFPDRADLFEPPKRAQGTVRRDDEHGESVELKGFINVDQPRVVLSIDGVISPIPEGGEKYGVQVISIQPPTVVLQRGRSRWTATLE